MATITSEHQLLQAFSSERIRWQEGDLSSPSPFFILVLNNIALERPLGSGNFVPDMNGTGFGSPDKSMFTDCAEYLFKSVFGKLPGQGDKLLARSPHAAKVRFHSMYVWGLVANGATALMGEETASGTGILNPRRDAISRMLKYMDVNPDVVFVVSNSPTHKRASAYPATDDTTRKGVQTSYQGSPFIHYHWHSVPGMAAIHATESTALTGAHEFCHAFSSYPNAFITDLYVDGNAAFNRKVGRPVPALFAEYAGSNYGTDVDYPYPVGWQTYHGVREDANNPALMDNFWKGSPAPNACRNDSLTTAFLLDRLAAKVAR